VADGAMGTLLFKWATLEKGQPPEVLNLSHPEVLEKVAAAYLEAGAEIIQANTFGGSAPKLAYYGLDGQTEAVNRAAVEAVRRVVGEAAYVSASCGPSGQILKPYGDAEPETVRSGFERQFRGAVEGGIDVVCVETMTDLAEATLAVRAAKAVAPEIPVMATMTFDPSPRGFFTVFGVTPEAAAAGLTEAGADVVGSNCGNGIENMVQIARELRAHTDAPLLIQSNAGQPQERFGETVYDETPEFHAEKAKDLVAAGVQIIGGCCGTTPDHIRAIRESIKS